MTQFSRRLEHLITNMHFFLVFPCLSKSPLYLGPSKSAVFFFAQNMKLALSTGRRIIANRQQLQFSWYCKGSVCQRMESNCSNGWRPKQIQVLEFWTMTWLWGFPLLTDTYWYYYTLFHCFIVQIGNQLFHVGCAVFGRAHGYFWNSTTFSAESAKNGFISIHVNLLTNTLQTVRIEMKFQLKLCRDTRWTGSYLQRYFQW